MRSDVIERIRNSQKPKITFHCPESAFVLARREGGCRVAPEQVMMTFQTCIYTRAPPEHEKKTLRRAITFFECIIK